MTSKAPPFLATSRLIIRPSVLGDAEHMTRMLSDPDVSSPFAIFKQPYDHEDSLQWCKTAQEDTAGSIGWFMSICLKDNEMFIGCLVQVWKRHDKTSFLPEICSKNENGNSCSDPIQSAEIGYWIGKEFWHLGYMAEALDVFISAAFDHVGIDYAYATTAIPNLNSQKALIKLGFIQAPDIFMRPTVTGKDRPSYYFKLTVDDWLLHKAAHYPAIHSSHRSPSNILPALLPRARKPYP